MMDGEHGVFLRFLLCGEAYQRFVAPSLRANGAREWAPDWLAMTSNHAFAPLRKLPDGKITGLSASAPLVSRTRCGALRAAPQSRDLSRHLHGGPGSAAHHAASHSASKTRANALMALRSIRGTTS